MSLGSANKRAVLDVIGPRKHDRGISVSYYSLLPLVRRAHVPFGVAQHIVLARVFGNQQVTDLASLPTLRVDARVDGSKQALA